MTHTERFTANTYKQQILPRIAVIISNCVRFLFRTEILSHEWYRSIACTMGSLIDYDAFVGVDDAYYSRIRVELFQMDPYVYVCPRYMQRDAKGLAYVTVTCHYPKSDDNQLNLRSTANVVQEWDQPTVDSQKVLDVTYVTQTSYLYFPRNDL